MSSVVQQWLQERLSKINKQIEEKNNLQNNILNIMELYDILSPVLKEKFIISKILDMKLNMELCSLRRKKEDLQKIIQNHL